MLTVRLDPELKARLTELAKATGRSKSYYVRQAIEEFLENRADYLIAISILEKNQPTIGINEIRRELDIEKEFLEFLDQDIRKNPHHVKNVPQALIARARELTRGVEVDLDAPLDPDDE